MSALPRENDGFNVGVEAQVEVQASAIFEESYRAISEHVRPVAVSMNAETLGAAGCGHAQVDSTGITFGGSVETPVGRADVYGQISIQRPQDGCIPPPVVETPPPVICETPPVVIPPPVMETPPVICETPPIVIPPPVMETPPVICETPPIVIPPPVMETPPVICETPPIVIPPVMETPPVICETPPVVETLPPVLEIPPPVICDTPPVPSVDTIITGTIETPIGTIDGHIVVSPEGITGAIEVTTPSQQPEAQWESDIPTNQQPPEGPAIELENLPSPQIEGQSDTVITGTIDTPLGTVDGQVVISSDGIITGTLDTPLGRIDGQILMSPEGIFTGTVDTPIGTVDGQVVISPEGIDADLMVEHRHEDRDGNMMEEIHSAIEVAVSAERPAGPLEPNELIPTQNERPKLQEQKPAAEIQATIDLSQAQASLSVNVPVLGSLNVHADRNSIKGLLSGAGLTAFGRIRTR